MIFQEHEPREGTIWENGYFVEKSHLESYIEETRFLREIVKVQNGEDGYQRFIEHYNNKRKTGEDVLASLPSLLCCSK